MTVKPVPRAAAARKSQPLPLSAVRALCAACRLGRDDGLSLAEWAVLNDDVETLFRKSAHPQDAVLSWLTKLTGIDLFLCDCCECWRDRDRSHRMADAQVCDPCHDDHSVCDDCEALVQDDDSHSVCNGNRHVCESCSGEYRSCCTCDYEGHSENMHRVDDEWYCEDHVPSEDDEEDSDGVLDSETNVIDELHNVPWLTIRGENTDQHGNGKSARPTLWLGFELEVVSRRGRWEAVRAVREALDRRGIVKNDGSLPDEGFEIVSLPATLAYHQTGWGDSFFATLARHAHGWDEKSCGMHVHMARDALTPLQIARLQVFVNGDGQKIDNRDFIEKVAGRGSTEYCKHFNKRLTDCAPVIERHEPIRPIDHDDCECASCLIQREAYARALDASRGSEALRHHFRQMRKANDGKLSRVCRDRRNTERYQAINLQNDATIEWRIFQSNVSRLGFLKNLEFCHAAAKFCSDAGNTGLHTHNFLGWIDRHRGEYPNFIRWAVRENVMARRHADAPGATQPAIAA